MTEACVQLVGIPRRLEQVGSGARRFESPHRVVTGDLRHREAVRSGVTAVNAGDDGDHGDFDCNGRARIQ